MKNNLFLCFFFFLSFPGALMHCYGQGFSFNTTGVTNSTNSMVEVLGVGTAANASGLYIDQSAAVTNAVYGFRLFNTSTSSTASINKYGLDIQSTGTWNGASSNNIGLQITATGGTNNYALVVPASSGIVGIGTISPTANYLLTVSTNATIENGIRLNLASGSAGSYGININSATASYNGILVSNSTAAAVGNPTYGIGSVFSGGTASSGYLAYRSTGSKNYGLYATGGDYAGYFTNKVTITSNTSPDGIADLEIQNPATGSGNPATVSLRPNNQITTSGNAIANLNFGSSYSTSPQAQIQIIRGAASSGSTDLPTDMLFYTTPDASSAMAERMRIINSGQVGINMYPSMMLDVTSASTTASDAAIRGASTGTGVTLYGVRGSTVATGNLSAGVFGISSGTGQVYGVLGQIPNSTAANAAGVRGYAGAASGATFGVWGENASSTGNATGVYGIATAATGSTNGVWGQANSTTTDAAGVYGTAIGNGQVYGVFGSISSAVTTSGASGVIGNANGTTGQIYGVTGITMSSTGIGVIGDAKETTGLNYGVYGISRSTNGTGVIGQCTTATGVTTGVWGEVYSTTNGATAVWGYSRGASGLTYGVLGQNASSSGYGVYGNAPRYGTYGNQTNATATGSGYNTGNTYPGVYGVASTSGQGSSGDYYHFGVHGSYCDCDAVFYGRRSGGVLGSNRSSSGTLQAWGSLGYLSSGDIYYGLYCGTGASSTGAGGGGRYANPNSQNDIQNKIAIGAYGGLLGGWLRGDVYGMNIKGERYSLYIDGRAYTNDVITQVSNSGKNERSVSYVSTSTSVDIYVRGKGKLQNGKATIIFDRNYSLQLSPEEQVMVTITPVGPSNGVYVTDVSEKGFTVIENNSGTSNVEFSWIAVGIRKGYEKPEHPKEILSSDYDEKMRGVMFNENDTTRAGTSIWWDGSQLRFDNPPVKNEESNSGDSEEYILPSRPSAPAMPENKSSQKSILPAGNESQNKPK